MTGQCRGRVDETEPSPLKYNISGQARMGKRFSLLSAHDYLLLFVAPFPYLR